MFSKIRLDRELFLQDLLFLGPVGLGLLIVFTLVITAVVTTTRAAPRPTHCPQGVITHILASPSTLNEDGSIQGGEVHYLARVEWPDRVQFLPIEEFQAALLWPGSYYDPCGKDTLIEKGNKHHEESTLF